jgi:sugar transferase (PEP-CTERM system associated)
MRIFKNYTHKVSFILLVAEMLVLILAFYFGIAFRFFTPGHDFFPALSATLPQAVFFAFVMMLSQKTMGMYHLSYREDFRHILLRMMPAFILGTTLITMIVYIAPDIYFGRGVLGLVIFLSALAILLTRFIFYKVSKLNFLKTQIMVLGTGNLAQECANIAEHNNNDHKFNIIGFSAVEGEELTVPVQNIFSQDKTLKSLVVDFHLDEIVVAVQNLNSKNFPIQQLLECKLYGINVIDASSFFEREMNQIRVKSLNSGWLVFGGGFDQSGLRISVKRTFDLLSSLILLLVSLPIMLITALSIYMEDRSPIFYRQERIGLNGIPFMVIKFRSMRNDAESGGTPKWASANDTRITKIGQLIRRLRIDELPQIFNVLKGEMSLIGPRPERDYFVKQLNEQIPYYNLRHVIRPGVTGWAQVRYQYGASVEDALQKLQYDLYYVKHNSLFLDIIILIDTVRVVLTGHGSR